jgi:hypothetical protein
VHDRQWRHAIKVNSVKWSPGRDSCTRLISSSADPNIRSLRLEPLP